MCGLQILNCTEAVKLSVYADDVVVLISNQNNVNVMLQTLEDFRNVSSAKVNWQKSEAVIVRSWLHGEHFVPAETTRDSFDNAVKKFLKVLLKR